MKGIQVKWICRIQNPTVFQMIEEAVVYVKDSLENITPQSFDALVVDTAPSYHAASSWAPAWMLQHVQ